MNPPKEPSASRDPALAFKELIDVRFELLGQQIEKLTQTIADQASVIAQLTAAIQETNRGIAELKAVADRQNQSIDGHLAVAQSQSANIASQSANISELTRLVTAQAETAQILISKLVA